MELEKLLKDKLAELSYELISLSSRMEKGENILSIVVDRVEPIDMDAIVAISHSLKDYLDQLDPISSSYTLDISSLGAEKPLKIESLESYLNRYVHVHLINPIEGNNIYEGDLSGVKDDSIALTYKVKTRIKTVDILKTNISKIRLAIKF